MNCSMLSTKGFWCFSCCVIFVAPALQSNAFGQIMAQPTARVQFHIVDREGKPVPWVLNHFTREGKEYISRFRGLVGENLPLGTYQYSLTSGGSFPLPVHGRLSVWQTECFTVVVLTEEQIRGTSRDLVGPRDFIIKGSISPAPGKSVQKMWIRLRPIFSSNDDYEDFEVDIDGQFRIRKVFSGRYVLLVMNGSEVRHIQLVSFSGGSRADRWVVRLPAESPGIDVVK